MRDLFRQKIIDAQAQVIPALTTRTIHVPKVPGKAVAVIGMRRSGKTTFLWQLLENRFQAGTPRQGLLYFSFEDERLADITQADLQVFVEEYYRLNPEWRDQGRATFFLDEIQLVPGWEIFARRLLDTENLDLFLSGSSARLLSREVATSMRGRAMEAVVFPFSFREFLRHTKREPQNPVSRLTKKERSEIENILLEYLQVGGFPESVGVAARDRLALLRGYVDTCLLRDVIERHGVSQPVALRWLIRHLLGNPAGSFSINKFSNDLRAQGIPVSKNTLHDLLSYLEDAFLIRLVSVDTESERRRMVNPRKVYPVDPGLIPVFDRSGKANLGHALENAVLIELERRGAEVRYVRTGSGFEVDFSARLPDGRQELIQVCADLTDPPTRDREIRALVEAAADYPKASLRVISLYPESRMNIPESIAMSDSASWFLEGEN